MKDAIKAHRCDTVPLVLVETEARKTDVVVIHGEIEHRKELGDEDTLVFHPESCPSEAVEAVERYIDRCYSNSEDDVSEEVHVEKQENCPNLVLMTLKKLVVANHVGVIEDIGNG